MTQVSLYKFAFKPNAKQAWLNWSEELKRRKDEVLATLKDEGVVSEACFISPDGEHVYYFMEAEDFEKVKNAATQSTHPIDAEHKTVRLNSLEFVAKLDCLFHFENR